MTPPKDSFPSLLDTKRSAPIATAQQASVAAYNPPPLAGLMEDPGVEMTSDAHLLNAYLQHNPTLPPLPMSIGDPYLLGGTLPPGLAAYERQAPAYLAGYSRTPAGLPEARRLIRDITIQEQELDQHLVVGEDFDMHLTSATGTRGIMRDFGRYLLHSHSRDDARTPVAT